MYRFLRSAVALAVTTTIADACPTCRTSLADASGHWAHGFALSIAVLLGVLLVAGGSFGFAVWRAVRGSD